MLSDAERWGKFIKAGRESQLFSTQDEFAKLIVELAEADGHSLTVKQSTVSRWESGATTPALRLRPYIAKALGIPVEVLFQRAEAAA